MSCRSKQKGQTLYCVSYHNLAARIAEWAVKESSATPAWEPIALLYSGAELPQG